MYCDIIKKVNYLFKNMKVLGFKSLMLVVLVGSTLMMGGCGEKLKEIKETKNSIETSLNEGKELIKQGRELVEQGKEIADKKDGIVGGLKNVLNGGASVKCEADDGWITYTNGLNFRSEGETDGRKQIVLMNDGVMYTWNPETMNEGVKFQKNCFSEIQKDLNLPETQGAEVFDDFSVETIEKEMKAGKISCKPSTEGNFEVPNGIQFVDQCVIFKNQMKGMKSQIEAIKKEQE